MRKGIIAAIGLIVVHIATEAWQLVYAIWPQSLNTTTNLFIDQKAIPDGIPTLWWVKMLTDEILLCYVFWDYAMTALRTSRKKFAVVFVFFVYHTFDAVMYLYNYKQWPWIYLVLLALDIAALVIIFLPIRETGKIIELDK